MKIKHFTFTAAVLAIACACQAVTVKTDRIRNRSVFGISFPSGTSLYMSSNSVTSISLHEYISGNITISEIVIDGNGSPSQVKIYHVRPIDPFEAGRDLASRAPGRLKNAAEIVNKMETAKDHIQGKTDIDITTTTDKIYKQYPTTTHSKTIEYAVDSLQELSDLYAALVKDFAGTQTNYKSKNAQDKQSENLPDRNIMGGKLYEVESSKK